MIAFIDIETSGLDPAYHDVIEVGCVFAEHGHRIGDDEFSVPFREDRAEPRALEVNGWGNRPFAEQITHDEAADRLEMWFEDDVTYFCSWHTTLDECFLNQMLRRGGRTVPWSHRNVIDLPSLVMGRLGVLTPGSSRELLVQLGLDPDFEDRHTALADAHANYRAYMALRNLGMFEMHHKFDRLG